MEILNDVTKYYTKFVDYCLNPINDLTSLVAQGYECAQVDFKGRVYAAHLDGITCLAGLPKACYEVCEKTHNLFARISMENFSRFVSAGADVFYQIYSSLCYLGENFAETFPSLVKIKNYTKLNFQIYFCGSVARTYEACAQIYTTEGKQASPYLSLGENASKAVMAALKTLNASSTIAARAAFSGSLFGVLKFHFDHRKEYSRIFQNVFYSKSS